MQHEILKKIEENREKIGILGLGYVGLPLAVTFAQKGVEVLGFEKNKKKVEQIGRSENYIADVEDEDLKTVVASGTLHATTDFSRIAECDALIICVPTPLDRFKKPDMRYIESACRDIGTYMKKGTFISLESTTFPTTTEDVMQPILEESSGLKSGEDFWLAFSPERVDPGNKKFKTANTPKVIGALTPEGLEIGKAVYGKAIEHLYPVSSPRVAEMVKILENTYRLINISLINELALLAGKMDINIWEVIEAAKTKPYGFQAFYPGPGVGGHCIPLDPFYLEYIAKNYHFDLTMIHTAGHIDNLMPHRMTIKINTALNRHKKPINGSKILFLGVAYKPNIGDERESPALKVMDEVCKKGGEVSFCDPYIEEVATPEGRKFTGVTYEATNLKEADCVVITTNHDEFEADFITEHSKLVVDMRNVIPEASEKVYKL
jgi:UDP-N-acetyl-D-glucosamine dehydrogenase